MVKFVWRVPERGYRWVAVGPEAKVRRPRSSGGSTTARTEVLVPVCPWLLDEYEPLVEHTGLFRTFADTRPTREGILEFANIYGNLGAEFDALDTLDAMEQPLHSYSPWDERAEPYDEACRGLADQYRSTDTLRRWQSQIAQMRRCVEAWDRVRRGQAGDETVREIHRVVNYVLDGDQFRVAFEATRRGSRMMLQVVPKSLLGALWAQFALSMAGDKEYRACPSCHRWFELAPETARTSRVYCREACRSRAYRARQERAVALAAEGWTAKEIAKDLESDVRIVQGWLRKKGR
jgi:endonuclease YncB( thermonuclease family)